MAKKAFYEEAVEAENPTLPLVDLSPRFNNLLLHEQPWGPKENWLRADLANLEYTPESAVNAAYFYLLGIRRLADPLEGPKLPRKWPILLFSAFVLGMLVLYYITHI